MMTLAISVLHLPRLPRLRTLARLRRAVWLLVPRPLARLKQQRAPLLPLPLQLQLLLHRVMELLQELEAHHNRKLQAPARLRSPELPALLDQVPRQPPMPATDSQEDFRC